MTHELSRTEEITIARLAGQNHWGSLHDLTELYKYIEGMLEETAYHQYKLGYDNGYEAGESHGFDKGHEEGYDDGYTAGESDGRDDGYLDGVQRCEEARLSGYDAGRDSGFCDGHAKGYEEGREEGYREARYGPDRG